MSEPATARQSHASLSSDLGFQNILGRSPAISEALALAHRVASSPRTTVLLLGETGAGKELFARGIHYAGPNSEQPFVAVNCAAIPENLLESELFGHERGAFTDARKRKSGLFELASGGTLFLDEVHQMPLSLQPKRAARRTARSATAPIAKGQWSEGRKGRVAWLLSDNLGSAAASRSTAPPL